MYAPADNMSDFTGVLVKRQYKPGQKYIQLLFQTSDGPILSISRNPNLVQSLSEGHTYRVEGQEYTIGEKKVINEPSAVLIKTEVAFFKRHLWKFGAFFIAAIIVAVIISLVFKSPHSSANSTNTGAKSSAAKHNNNNLSTTDSNESSNPTSEAQSQLSARDNTSGAASVPSRTNNFAPVNTNHAAAAATATNYNQSSPATNQNSNTAPSSNPVNDQPIDSTQQTPAPDDTPSPTNPGTPADTPADTPQ
jgi:hypothetical protein